MQWNGNSTRNNRA